MGSCASRSTTTADFTRAVTATIVDFDGSMAQFAAPVTAHEALMAYVTPIRRYRYRYAIRRHRDTAFSQKHRYGDTPLMAATASSSSRFLCCSDELRFDSPARAMAAHEALQAEQLYFALPLTMLGRPLSGQDMAALAVKATAALGAAPVVVDVSSQDKAGYDDGAAGTKKQRQRQTGRVAPLVVVSGDGSWHADGERTSWHVSSDVRKAAVYGYLTVGKTRNGGGYIGGARRLSAGQRLSVIVEADSESN
ncbi:hypothetical protein EJB05_43583, partial [Eragrostis curvula]